MARSKRAKKARDSDDNDKAPLEEPVEEELNEIWYIERGLTQEEIASSNAPVCMQEECKEIACARWCTNLEPDKTWFNCEKCQESDFGGWPSGWGPFKGGGFGKLEDDPAVVADKEKDGVVTPDVTLNTMSDAMSDSAQDITPDATPNVTPKSTPNAKRQDCPENDIRAENSTKKIRRSEMEDSGDALMKTPEEVQEASNDVNEEDVKEEDEVWSLKTIYTEHQISGPDPVKCQTDGCSLLACVMWSSSLGVTWNGCMDCQADDLGGWPEGNEPKWDVMQFLVDTCSKRPMPKVLELEPQTESPGPFCPFSKNLSEEKKQEVAVVTPNLKGPSPGAVAVHRKWQEMAEKMGGKGARIVVEKNEIKKLVFDVLHLSFQPMNNNDIYLKLKAVVPAALLKQALDSMTFDPMGHSDDESDDSEDEEDGGPKKKKKKDKVESNANNSNDPYMGSIILKTGRGVSSNIYYADQTRLANKGNGLPFGEKMQLQENLAQAEQELQVLNGQLASAAKETTKLAGEPTNSEADATLETEGIDLEDMREQAEASRELLVNDAERIKTRDCVNRMVIEWRKRRGMCFRFIRNIEDLTEGVITLKQCLKDGGQIGIESDEMVIAAARESAMARHRKVVGKSRIITPNKYGGGRDSGSKLPGLEANPAFIGVRLDNSVVSEVCRVFTAAEHDD